MQTIDVVKTVKIKDSFRTRQFESMFDVPRSNESRSEWHGEIDIAEPWNVGLIVGPSGSGKSILLNELFGEHIRDVEWDSKLAVIDCFDKNKLSEEISATCLSVGFGTIPAWLRPYSYLSNGEKFRVDIARRLLESESTIVVDEFTSVVDRQVAKITSNSVQKYIRKNNKKFVAASCHYDIIDWLQPDWILEPASMKLTRRCLQRRPTIEGTISPVDYSAWSLFKKYHYLTANMNNGARCWCLFVEEQPAAFVGILHRPHPCARNIKGISRAVTLPDYQGLGLIFILMEYVASIYRAMNFRMMMYPAHSSFVRNFLKNKNWVLRKKSGEFSSNSMGLRSVDGKSAFGQRPCAVFEYIGAIAERNEAERMLSYWK